MYQRLTHIFYHCRASAEIICMFDQVMQKMFCNAAAKAGPSTRKFGLGKRYVIGKHVGRRRAEFFQLIYPKQIRLTSYAKQQTHFPFCFFIQHLVSKYSHNGCNANARRNKKACRNAIDDKPPQGAAYVYFVSRFYVFYHTRCDTVWQQFDTKFQIRIVRRRCDGIGSKRLLSAIWKHKLHELSCQKRKTVWFLKSQQDNIVGECFFFL